MTRAVALEFQGPGKIGLTHLDFPAPRSDEVLVRVRACGICMFDVNTFRGKLSFAYPRVAGHEGVGVIEAIGDGVTSVAVGDKVAFLGGPALSEYCLVKQSQVALIPADTTDYALWIAEPAACVINGARSARVEPGDTVVLIGTGYMGLLMVQALPKEMMNQFIVIDVDDDRLALARRCGATVTINAQREDALAEVRRRTGGRGVRTLAEEQPALGRLLRRAPQDCQSLSPADLVAAEQRLGSKEGRQHDDLTAQDILLIERAMGRGRSGVDIVIEAAGAKGTIDLAGQMLRPGGRLSIFSFHTAPEEVDLPRWHMQGFEVQNPAPNFSRNTTEDFQDAIRLMHRGVLDQRELITHRFPHTAAQEALELTAARPKGYIKAAITFD